MLMRFHKSSEIFSGVLENAHNINVKLKNHKRTQLSSEAKYSEIVSIGLFSLLGILIVIAAPFFVPSFYGNESFESLLSLLLVLQSLHFLSSVILLALRNFYIKSKHIVVELVLYTLLSTSISSLALLYQNNFSFIATWWIGISIAIFLQRLVNKNYSLAGHAFYISISSSILVGLLWSAVFFVTIDISLMTRILLLVTAPFLIISIPSGYLRMFEVYDVLCRDHWRKPRHPFPKNWHKYEPFVSIHVPTYSEPPNIVIETLNKLAAIDYNNYEVIVIDNNTQDPRLWQPVKAHCEKLGKKFRFMHEMEVSGAKGGALNLIHDRIDSRATILAIIDADYQVKADFLSSLVGYFQNPKVGFVQTPHDYRNWQNNVFLTMCYWEYRLFFHSAMIGLNERDAGITVGTMCLVRKEALEKAGGWSEWCVTEDSELAIRIHDVGYTSVYVSETYGRGLIPETFEDYKKQRYRWTAGPVQEFRHYFRHFLGISGQQSELGFFQRLFHLNHGLGNFLNALNIPLIVLGVLVVTSMIWHKEIIQVPFELWLAATISLVSVPILIALIYKITLRASIMDIFAQSIAAAALSHVIYLASIKTAITGNAKWDRTNKFKTNQTYLNALVSAKEELIISLLLLTFIAVAWGSFPYNGFSAMLLIGLFYVALRYLAAPLMAVLAVRNHKKQIRV